MEKTQGHIGFYGRFEYAIIDGVVARTPVSNAFGVEGRRMGFRYEAPLFHLEDFQNEYGATVEDWLAYKHGDFDPDKPFFDKRNCVEN